MLEAVPHIAVEISAVHAELGDQWRALSERAAANVFVNPVVSNAVVATGLAGLQVLTAWDRTTNIAKLIGVWALGKKPLAPLGPSVLVAPAHDYAFVSNPVIDPAHIDAVMPAFFDAIAADPKLPKVIRLRYLDGGMETAGAIMTAAARRRLPVMTLSERERAYAVPDAAVKRSGSTAKKLRQDWNRLAKDGAVAVANARDTDAAVAAFETFLTLEAASWKAGRGTAILSEAADARFARRLIADLAAAGEASVALLTLDGKAIAAQVLLYSGRTAYTWKTAFDPDYGRFSPGALLVDRVTTELFASGAIDAIESCSPDGGFMARLWTGRRKTLDVLIDLNPRKSLAFRLAALEARGYAGLKDIRDAFRARWTEWRRKRQAASAGTADAAG